MSSRKAESHYNFIAGAAAAALIAGSAPALAAAPVGTAAGNEFGVNVTTAGDQQFPVVAFDAVGDFVVVWEGPDSSGNGIHARRYHADGSANGGEFTVNLASTGEQTNPAVAMDAEGGFVVVWQGPDAASTGVFGKLYDKDGGVIGAEFAVNTTTASDQSGPKVAMDSSGNFLVVWQSPDANGYGIFGQRFDNTGTKTGATEFGVNSATLGSQTSPALAMNAAGTFVVAWKSSGTESGIIGRLFNSDGNALSDDFQVNEAVIDDPSDAAAAIDYNGDSAITWLDGDISGSAIYGRRFASDGSASGSQFQVSSGGGLFKGHNAAAMDVAGDLIVTWHDNNQDGSGSGVYAQAYGADGTAHGGNFLVNTTTANAQSEPSVAMGPLGHALIAWQSTGQDGAGEGVYAQRYQGVTDRAVDLTADLSISPTGIVMPGTTLVLTAHIGNNVGVPTTNDTVTDAVLSTVGNLSVTVTMPSGTHYLGYNPGTGNHWICANPPAYVITCSYDQTLAPGDDSSDFTVTVSAPGNGGLALFTDEATSSDAVDTVPANDLGATGVFLIGPIVSDGLVDANRNTAKSGVLQGADLEGNSLVFSLAAKPAHGTVTVQAGGKFSYKPAAGYAGTDSFTFKGTAGGSDSNIGTMSVTVTEHLPTANPASFSVSRNSSHAGKLTASDADKGDKLGYKRASKPAHGSVTVSSSGAFSYTPKANFHGHDSFTFTVSDGLADDTATISITVK